MLERHEEGIRTLKRFDHKTFYIISVLRHFLTQTPKKFENSISDFFYYNSITFSTWTSFGWSVFQFIYRSMRVCNSKIYQRHTKIKSIFILPYSIHILFSVTILVQQKIEMTVCFIIEHLLLFPAILLDIPEPVVEWAQRFIWR